MSNKTLIDYANDTSDLKSGGILNVILFIF